MEVALPLTAWKYRTMAVALIRVIRPWPDWRNRKMPRTSASIPPVRDIQAQPRARAATTPMDTVRNGR